MREEWFNRGKKHHENHRKYLKSLISKRREVKLI